MKVEVDCLIASGWDAGMVACEVGGRGGGVGVG
jgi:hypothetical protein